MQELMLLSWPTEALPLLERRNFHGFLVGRHSDWSFGRLVPSWRSAHGWRLYQMPVFSSRGSAFIRVCVCLRGGQSEVWKDEKCLRVIKGLAVILGFEVMERYISSSKPLQSLSRPRARTIMNRGCKWAKHSQTPAIWSSAPFFSEVSAMTA